MIGFILAVGILLFLYELNDRFDVVVKKMGYHNPIKKEDL